MHELDEVLGIGGQGSQLSNTNAIYQTNGSGPNPAEQVGPMDLYRYSAPGVRSFSLLETTTPYSYFSIDGGNTVLSYFNQIELADFGDWLSDPIPAGYGPQVQDAFGTAGADPTLGVNELKRFREASQKMPKSPFYPLHSCHRGMWACYAAVGDADLHARAVIWKSGRAISYLQRNRQKIAVFSSII